MKLTKEQRKNEMKKLSKQDYEERYVGRYKGHIRKIMAACNIAMRRPYAYNQADQTVVSLVIGIRKKDSLQVKDILI